MSLRELRFEYQDFLAENGLPDCSADEMQDYLQEGQTLKPWQVRYLAAFTEEWDEVAAKEEHTMITESLSPEWQESLDVPTKRLWLCLEDNQYSPYFSYGADFGTLFFGHFQILCWQDRYKLRHLNPTTNIYMNNIVDTKRVLDMESAIHFIRTATELWLKNEVDEDENEDIQILEAEMSAVAMLKVAHN